MVCSVCSFQTPAGEGKVYKCLFNHKFEESMSEKVRLVFVWQKQLLRMVYRKWITLDRLKHSHLTTTQSSASLQMRFKANGGHNGYWLVFGPPPNTVKLHMAFCCGQPKAHLCNNHAVWSASWYATPVRCMDYLGKGEVLTNTDLDRFVNNIWQK